MFSSAIQAKKRINKAFYTIKLIHELYWVGYISKKPPKALKTLFYTTKKINTLYITKYDVLNIYRSNMAKITRDLPLSDNKKTKGLYMGVV
jgi:hypothetical protein